MGDIWPYGPPKYITWNQAYSDMRYLGFTKGDAAIFAAIGAAESGLDFRVINDTASTGDYSVGIWQINYFGDLYKSRTKQFGTPKQLIKAGHPAQSLAAQAIYNEQGFSAWTTYTSGAYKQYLHGVPTKPIGSRRNYIPVPAPTSPGKDSWSVQIIDSSERAHAIAKQANAIARGIIALRG